MGFFSWECAKTKKPVMADDAVRNTPFQFASEVVVIFNDGDRITGTYDGYGRIYDRRGTEIDLMDYQESCWRMVIQKFYNNESFEQLEKNHHEPKQGFFWDDDQLEKVFK